ncbi:MAG: cation:proton antiporter [Atribacterota bacterium]
MAEMYLTATLWFALAVLATVLASHLKISIALVEICVGAMASYVLTHLFGPGILRTDAEWLRFLAGTGSILLTFLAGTELDSASWKTKAKESLLVGLIGFFAPFVGCSLVARFVLSWDPQASLLAGIALSTTSMAVVYSVMLEYGFNRTEFGKGILGSCFVNDLGTVIALGVIFAPFSYRMVLFVVVSLAAFLALPYITTFLTSAYGFKTAAIRTKWILFLLFGLGALALWAESEAVLPAYIAGMILANTIGQDSFFIRRVRTLTVGFLTPLYFLRAGALVSIPALFAAPMIFLVLLAGKVSSKILGLFPIIKQFRRGNSKESWYYTLLMSTGLTFGTISALYGLTHGIITKEQYSYLVAVVIGSAVIPTMVANVVFVPKHLLNAPEEGTVSQEKILQEANP